MPELPEVETIRRGLEKYILEKKIIKVEIKCEKSFLGNEKEIVGKKVKKIRRFGKALVLDLEGEISALVHLRMTGQLIYDGTERYAAGHPSENFLAELPNKQTRVLIEFEEGKLFFNDQRKFGFIKIVPTVKILEDSFIKKLAKEPWGMDTEEFYAKLQKHRKSSIKAVILDQTVICGLGNIYADEALFESKIHPVRRAGSLSREEAEELLFSAREVMTKSIESGGSTMATYVKADGTRGDYLEKFAQVFRRDGKACFRCGEKIVKIKVAGRGTHVCPKCQKLEGGEKND